MIKYNIYATILDVFQSYINSDEIYNDYYGHSDDPELTQDEFSSKKFQELIDRINRVPFDSEAADKGTCFGEAVDCVIEGRKSDKMELKSDKEIGLISASYNKRTFFFPVSLVREFADYFKGALTQVRTEGILQTKYGDVLLYGNIDELLCSSVHDIKTTSKYKAGKFRNNWQHVAYLYCLNKSGNKIDRFEYNVTDFKNTYTEVYMYNEREYEDRLRVHCELLIEFITAHKNIITDEKIFNHERELEGHYRL